MKLTVEMRPGSDKGQSLRTEDGEMVEGVKSVTWHADAVERPLVTVQLFAERVTFDLSEETPDPEPEATPDEYEYE